jgi:hypothetical protein
MCVEVSTFHFESDIGELLAIGILSDALEKLVFTCLDELILGARVCVENVYVFQVVLPIAPSYNKKSAVNQGL